MDIIFFNSHTTNWYLHRFFTHGDKDERVLIHHFDFFKEYINKHNIKAKFWLVKDSYHVDAMFKYPDEYGIKLKNFFEEHLNN